MNDNMRYFWVFHNLSTYKIQNMLLFVYTSVYKYVIHVDKYKNMWISGKKV